MRIGYSGALSLLHHQEVLESSLESLVNRVKQLEPHSDAQLDIEQALSAAHVSAAAIRLHLNGLVNSVPPHERPPTAMSGVKAKEVFSTPELLELIFSAGLSTKDKLRAMCVQRCWRDGIKGSVSLRRSLGLSISQNTFFYSPFAHLSPRNRCASSEGHLPGGAGFAVRLNEYAPLRGMSFEFNKICFNVGGYPDVMQHLGSRVRAMTICNPPVRELRVIITKRCECNRHLPNIDYKIESASVLGFTVGELQRRDNEIKKQDPHCSRCKESCAVLFSGSLVLCAEDPLVESQAKNPNADRAGGGMATVGRGGGSAGGGRTIGGRTVCAYSNPTSQGISGA